MKARYYCQGYTALFFSLFLLMGCGGGSEFALETEKIGDGEIETVNPEGSIARKLHPRDFEREEDWVRETCSVYEDEDLPLPDGNFNANSNFPLDEDSVWTCVRRTESFQIDTEIRFYDNGTYYNNLTGWQVIIADASVAFPPDQGCHRRGGCPTIPLGKRKNPGLLLTGGDNGAVDGGFTEGACT